MPLAELTSRQPLRSPQPQKGFLTGPEPRPLPGLRYQGNFSISRLRLQIRPLADENKGLFMGSGAHLLLLHCVFYALSVPQSVSTESAIVFALTDGTKEKHRKLSGSRKVAENVRAELRREARAPCSQEHHLPTPRPGCQRPEVLGACKSPSAVRLAAHVFRTTSADPWVEGAILQNQLKANGRANTQKSQSGGYGPLRR